jgi:hypothetical protein
VTLVREVDRTLQRLDRLPFQPPPAPVLPLERRRPWYRALTESRVIDAVVLIIYFIVAQQLTFHYSVIYGDAVSRMANAFYVLYSRDPHIAAIGFVWNPLQSIADLFPLLFKDLWSPLATRDMAGCIVSALSMMGAVHQSRAAFHEWGVSRLPRIVLTVLFAINPMILLFSANGMSEALFLFTLVATARYLARWIRHGDTRSLVYSAVALGLCYLARNEAVFAAALGGTLVTAVSFRRATGERRPRIMIGLTDLTVFLLPVILTFAGWAMASLVIVGQPFAQLQSVYGTSSQIAVGGVGYAKLGLIGNVKLELNDLFHFAPLLPAIVLVALYIGWKRRDATILAVLTIAGGGLAFDLLAWLHGGITYAFRYFISTIPLAVLSAGTIVGRPGRAISGEAQPSNGFDTAFDREETAVPGAGQRHRPALLLKGIALSLVAVVLVGPSLPATAAGMFNRRLDPYESEYIGFIFHKHPTAEDISIEAQRPAILRLVNAIAGLHLPDSTIVVDNFSNCIPSMIVASPNPKVFVIPNDRDYQRVLDDPLTFHARYIMVPKPTFLDTLTSTNRAYPTLYANGSGFARLARNFPSYGTCPALRLYRVTGHPNSGQAEANGQS